VGGVGNLDPSYPGSVPAPPATGDCPLCRAEKLSPWYLDDDLCWIAECTICTVPMVVLRAHVKEPDPATKAELHARLAGVVGEHFTFEHYVDDDMRQIPDHYHAHARPVGGFFGHPGLRRSAAPEAAAGEA
jgi:hypothetical protein